MSIKDPDAGSTAKLTARSCWPLIIRWAERLIAENDPFAIFSVGAASFADSIVRDNASFCISIPEDLAQEAAESGITVLTQPPVSVAIDKAVTPIDRDTAGEAYSSLAFNILVNRVARLSGSRLSLSTSPASLNEKAADLAAFLQNELMGYGIISSPEEATVSAEDGGSLGIMVNTETTVSGHPVHFAFSVGVS